MIADVDKWIEIAKRCKYLPEDDLRELCNIVCDLLLEEPNVQPVQTPVTVCGDIHGQFYDLEELFNIGGQVPETQYIFMGDYVDRGYYSLETLTLLMAFKARYPDRIILLRGNHETCQITKVYGFYDECLNKYGNANAWKDCCRVFDLLTVAARLDTHNTGNILVWGPAFALSVTTISGNFLLIDESVLCVHGGLSPEISMLDQIRCIDRNQQIPHKGAFCDLLWSDPIEDDTKWSVSPRGAGWLFGRVVTELFMSLNDLTLICRAHQLVNDGYKYMFDQRLVTIWSAPNYCYRCGNVASIMEFNTVNDRNAKIFNAVADSEREVPPQQATPYFL